MMKSALSLPSAHDKASSKLQPDGNNRRTRYSSKRISSKSAAIIAKPKPGKRYENGGWAGRYVLGRIVEVFIMGVGIWG